MAGEARFVARMRAAFVCGTSIAVSVAAHALAGGEAPGQAGAVLLVAVAVAVGVLAGGTRLSVPLALAAGQVIGHLVLALDEGHLHVPGPVMFFAHVVAIAVAALLVRGAESGCRVALAALRRIVPDLYSAAPVRLEGSTPPAYRTRVRRGVLLAGGRGTRGPPVTV
ncbi:hypothetical protein [Rhodococcus chondri]|uniref:Integral membrane protein n=1 Tax=Rhodococcus chondri TaxID=3065941 RepID=A0ABU7JPU2_9NOCA|nr:hypothetical protein [Rhodococcus sp. CC-R104]MEE2031762.1 hypothetical protein [Rhodococcus sp. CC-R104]